MLTIVGQGLAGTLAAFEAEKRGRSFVVVDQGSGSTASRAAAGIFNPLTGPRFTADDQNWNQLAPYYRDIEDRLGIGILHLTPLRRPLAGAKVGREAFPRSASGWSADLCTQGESDWVQIEGGGWVGISTLLDAARERWLKTGQLEQRRLDPEEVRDKPVVWCGGIGDFTGSVWSSVPAAAQAWQGVRGDVLTVKILGLDLAYVEIGARFLLPLGSDLYRWGATHEIDVVDLSLRPDARKTLENELALRLEGRPYEVLEHSWGVRPASRTKAPLILRHPLHPNWTLFNGFGGRGVALIPRNLAAIGS